MKKVPSKKLHLEKIKIGHLNGATLRDGRAPETFYCSRLNCEVSIEIPCVTRTCFP